LDAFGVRLAAAENVGGGGLEFEVVVDDVPGAVLVPQPGLDQLAGDAPATPAGDEVEGAGGEAAVGEVAVGIANGGDVGAERGVGEADDFRVVGERVIEAHPPHYAAGLVSSSAHRQNGQSAQHRKPPSKSLW
jgi:hypothetical protein